MVNYGFNSSALLGLIYIIFSLVYLVLVISVLVRRRNSSHELSSLLYIFQAFIFPIILALCGLILLVNGWRLDPVLQFEQFLLTILIFYLSLKDIFIDVIYRNR